MPPAMLFRQRREKQIQQQLRLSFETAADSHSQKSGGQSGFMCARYVCQQLTGCTKEILKKWALDDATTALGGWRVVQFASDFHSVNDGSGFFGSKASAIFFIVVLCYPVSSVCFILLGCYSTRLCCKQHAYLQYSLSRRCYCCSDLIFTVRRVFKGTESH